MRSASKIFLLIFFLSILTSSCNSLSNFPTATPMVTILPAEIAVLNVKTEVTQDGSTQTTAELSISPIGKGSLEVTAPSEMSISDTRTVKLIIIPENVALNITPTPNTTPTPQSAIAQQQQQYIATQKAIEMYPVMIADLKGLNFDILPNTATQKIVTSYSIVEWLWAITPQQSGKQIILLSLSTPVAVGKNREIFSSMEITSLSIEITVFPNGSATFTASENPSTYVSPTLTFEPSITPTLVPPTFTPQPTISQTATQLSTAEKIGDQIIENIGIIIVAVITLTGTIFTAVISNRKKRNDESEKNIGNKRRKKTG